MSHHPLHVSEPFRKKDAAGEKAIFPAVISEIDSQPIGKADENPQERP